LDAYLVNEILLALLVVTFAGAVHGTFGLGLSRWLRRRRWRC
jgi:uncharacterized protein